MFKSMEEDKCINLEKTEHDISVGVSLDSINVESYRNIELSELYKELPSIAGYLVPLKCGHNGIYSKNEFEIYQNYLIKSNIIN